VAALLYIWPFATKQKTCYEEAQQAITEIEYNIVARALSLEAVCEQRLSVLELLGQCLKQATVSAQYVAYTYSFIEGAVNLSRPTSQGFSTMQHNHNMDCEEYSEYFLP
jgi:hypothetical protein